MEATKWSSLFRATYYSATNVSEMKSKTYLKDFGAATASNGAVGLYHVENITPEAVESGRDLILEDAKVYVVDDAELERVYKSYPVIWKNADAKPKLCFMGCPHMSLEQLITWTVRVHKALKKNGKKKVVIPTVFTAAPAVIEEFNQTKYAKALKQSGVVLSYICPLMYMNNPLSACILPPNPASYLPNHCLLLLTCYSETINKRGD